MLEARDITVRFSERTVLDDVSLTVADGEVVAVLGPSGIGKSTLLRVLAGLLVADAGSVWLDGADITRLPSHRRDIGLVFQDEQLFPHLDVAANIGFGLRMQGATRAATAARVTELLALVGLAGFEHRRAPRPRVLLLDEPLTGLDRDLHDRLAAEVATLLRATCTTALLVTHDRDEAAAIADRTVVLAS